MKYVFQKTKKLLLVVATLFCAFALSGVGYPNDDTVIIGPDVREDVSPLYNISLEVPKTVTEDQEFTARVSIESADNFTATSEATVSVTGGTLANEQTQPLTPDAVWKIRATSHSLVGVVVSVQTKMSPKDKPESETTYLDTVSSSVEVASSAAATGAASNNQGTASAFRVSRAKYVWGGVVAVVFVASVGILFFRKKH